MNSKDKWKIISDSYSSKTRTYKNKYLEIEEEYNNYIILSVFSLKNDMYAIYVDYYNKITGITYATKGNVYRIKEEIKKDLEEDYKKCTKGSDEFFKYFNKKYNIRKVPEDFFDENYDNKW